MTAPDVVDALWPERRRRAPRSRLNAFGDLICPACGAQLLTPPGHYVRSGSARCAICSTPFRVTTTTARAANRRTEAFQARMATEALLHANDA